MHPSIELFRGIAAWMVLTSHYASFFIQERSLLNFLQTGVDLFFIISGFVFAPAIEAGKIAVMPYLIRRFFRIYPLYLCSLFLYYWFSSSDPNQFSFFINHLFFLHTTHSVEEVNFFNIAYWTLPIEAEFYLLVPLFVIARYKYFIHIIFILAILLKTILTFTSAELSNPNLSSFLNFHLPGFLIEFMVGIILFKLYVKYRDKEIPIMYHVLIIIIAMSLLSGLSLFFIWQENDPVNGNLLFKSYFHFWCAISYAILLFPFLITLKKTDSFFYSACLFMGNISYGVYLFHNLMPQVLSGYNLSGLTGYLLCSCATVIITLVFYYIVENPSRLFGRKLSSALNTPRK
ncbi:hypothetical protein PN36_16600 [Candidatus Thiomargarita nelsonii]|uniref:Acyltransferase 3 domain-containing protein n=1 Tax=Candidatus Thiomargarita nelsonii TaxID=1003181 RepID=A0A0A6P5V5_9GAMM|nr:hypothetical protein PN36_16600 [Candidatus Thiomargarita nelsonii]